ncbi:MAG TPA: CbiX/SirB N-terminal domain-containing protein [Chthonomonadales bacterium]|nr:CbiX/SirB N-terminal domain-containing protein [Chthonomonadales bacterium]
MKAGVVRGGTLIALLLVAAVGMALLSVAFADSSRTAREKVAVVVVGHGTPPKDFPRDRLRELGRLHSEVMEAGGKESAPSQLVERKHALEREMRRWKRTPENDPYDAAVREVAASMKRLGGYDIVEVAHNEFSGLDVGEAVDSVISEGARRVYVLSVMTIRGGAHSERDILGKVKEAKREHPGVRITYAWPYETELLARLFVEQVNRFQRQ